MFSSRFSNLSLCLSTLGPFIIDCINKTYFIHIGSLFTSAFYPKPIYTQNFSSRSGPPRTLNSHWLSGFIDAEGCFKVVIWKDKASKIGWGVRVEFSIELHCRELALLKQIQSFFGGVGNIKNNKQHGSVVYTITKFKDIRDVLIPHFKKSPLLTQKSADFC
jgi:hypothetical protein